MAVLEFESASKEYDSGGARLLAVDNFDLRVGDGEIVGLLGSSGCGKTTTLRAAAGFVRLTSGEIRIDGSPVGHLPPARRGVAMAFEGYALYPPLRVRENIGFALLRGKKPGATIDAAVREIAALLEIENILEQRPSTISAGEQQRTSLARALIRRAPVTLLDEPMSQLEPQLRAGLRSRIKEYLRAHKMTTVFVTHDQNEATALADRIAVMEKGVLQQCASPRQLQDRPDNLFVAGFIGEPPMNLLSAKTRRTNGKLEIVLLREGKDAGLLLAPEFAEGDSLPEKFRLGIRPHRVLLDEGQTLRGRVVSNQWLGDQTHILVDVGGLRVVVVGGDRLSLRAGDETGLDFPSEAMAFFDENSGAALPLKFSAKE